MDLYTEDLKLARMIDTLDDRLCTKSCTDQNHSLISHQNILIHDKLTQSSIQAQII